MRITDCKLVRFDRTRYDLVARHRVNQWFTCKFLISLKTLVGPLCFKRNHIHDVSVKLSQGYLGQNWSLRAFFTIVYLRVWGALLLFAHIAY